MDFIKETSVAHRVNFVFLEDIRLTLAQLIVTNVASTILQTLIQVCETSVTCVQRDTTLLEKKDSRTVNRAQ